VTTTGYSVSSPSAATDAAAFENKLLDECGLFGRRYDVKSLLKWFNMARSGQTKTVLITGDEGVGKTRLLQTLEEVCLKANYGQVLDLRGIYHVSGERLYCHLLDALNNLAEQLLEQALAQLCDLPTDLGLSWDFVMLKESLQLVKPLDQKSKVVDLSQQEALVRKIRSQIPVSQKLKRDITPELERIVGILSNPWLSIAHGILSQDHPSIQKAYRYKESLKPRMLMKENKVARALNELLEEGSVDGSGETSSEVDVADNVSPDVSVAQAKLVKTSAPVRKEPSDAEEDKTTQSEMVRHLMKVMQFINNYLRQSDSALLILMDDWQDVAILPESDREGLKRFVSSWLTALTEANNFYVMVCLATRPEGQSYSLGGELYSRFYQKLLLAPLPEMAFKKLLLDPLKQHGIQLDLALSEELFTISRGNPFWLTQCRRFIEDWSEVTERKTMALTDFQEMGIHSLSDFLELGFTRIKLQFMHQEDRFLDCLERLLEQYERRPFLVQDVIQLLSDSPSFSQQFIFDVMRGLYKNHFINEVALQGGRNEDPVYMFDSRIVVEFLRQKMQELQPKVTPQDQLHFLKQVIPLSLRSGELSREKTQELIAMNRVLGNTEMTEFLENVFTNSLKDPSPSVRSSALRNLAAIPTETTMDRILGCLEDWDESVRVCALENMSILMDFQGIGHGFVTQEVLTRIWAALSLRTSDDSSALRGLAYQTLGKLHWYADAEGLLLQGTEDTDGSVRLLALEALLKMDAMSEAVAPHLLRLLKDPDQPVRILASKAITRIMESFPELNLAQGDLPEIVSSFIADESDPKVKMAFIQSLHVRFSAALVQSLIRIYEKETSEDVQVAILRLFAKAHGVANGVLEPFLWNLIEKPQTTPLALVWAAVKALAQVADKTESLEKLRHLKEHTASDILWVAIDSAIKQIQNRQYQFRVTLEHQLRTPSNAGKPYARKSERDKEAIEVQVGAQVSADEAELSPESHLTEAAVTK
jgi:HEAT repeat protein/energy-coupling factor transporter ATP-binding protein EcfA2